jgi:hypothetical protein
VPSTTCNIEPEGSDDVFSFVNAMSVSYPANS